MADDPTEKRARPVRRRFTQILDALEKTGARYALCGATAMGAHGVRRFTEDLDFFVDDRDLERLLEMLAKAFREVAREPKEGPPSQVRIRARRAKSAASVDIDLMVPVDAAEAWALASSVRAKAFDRKVDVISAEALVVLKLRAYLSNPDAPKAQVHRADAARILHETRVDIASLRRFVASDPALAAQLEYAVTAQEMPPRRHK